MVEVAAHHRNANFYPSMKNQRCPACDLANPARDKALQPATHCRILKGSGFVGSRGIKGLFVCRDCSAMWQKWYDQYYGLDNWRILGQSIVPIFAADTSLPKVIDWLLEDYSRSMFSVVDALATKCLRRLPAGIKPGVKKLMAGLNRLIPPRDELQVERSEMLFHILGCAVERSIRSDLRPKVPRLKPPRRFSEADLEQAAEFFQPYEVEGLAYLSMTRDALRRLLWESRWESGADSPDQAVIAIDDTGPIRRFLKDIPLFVVADGVLRGVYSNTAYKAARLLHHLGRLPENDHAVWLPAADWNTLKKLLDPVERLAASWRRIDAAQECNPKERLARLQMETILVREPVKFNARFTPKAREALLELETLYSRRPEIPENSGSRASIQEILALDHSKSSCS